MENIGQKKKLCEEKKISRQKWLRKGIKKKRCYHLVSHIIYNIHI